MKETIKIRIDNIDEEVNELQKKWNNLIPYQVGDTFEVFKEDCEKYFDELHSHPRKRNFEVPIMDVVVLDNNYEFWLSYGQLREMIERHTPKTETL